MLAIDHGYFQGPTTGLEKPGKTVAALLPHADALMLTRGVLRNAIDAEVRIPIVLRVSGGTSILKEDLSDEDRTVSIEDAIRLNASCLALSIFVGSANEKQSLTNLAKLCDDGQKYGVPVLAEIEKRAERPTSIGSIYAALGRLENLGYVGSRLGESTPVRGGRAKRYFWVEAPGEKALNDSLRSLGALDALGPPRLRGSKNA